MTDVDDRRVMWVDHLAPGVGGGALPASGQVEPDTLAKSFAAPFAMQAVARATAEFLRAYVQTFLSDLDLPDGTGFERRFTLVFSTFRQAPYRPASDIDVIYFSGSAGALGDRQPPVGAATFVQFKHREHEWRTFGEAWHRVRRQGVSPSWPRDPWRSAYADNVVAQFVLERGDVGDAPTTGSAIRYFDQALTRETSLSDILDRQNVLLRRKLKDVREVSPVTERFVLDRQFTGRVREVDRSSNLVEAVLAERANEADAQLAVLSLNEFNASDRPSIDVGSVFYWVLGYRERFDDDGVLLERVGESRFLMMPSARLTDDQLEEADQLAEALWEKTSVVSLGRGAAG